MTNVMVFGAQGQLGRALRTTAWPQGWEASFLSRGDCDLTDFSTIRAAILLAKPDLIINAAAYTGVDLAESEPDIAWATNAMAPAAMAEAAALVGSALVHVSTDYVFSGSVGPAWVEDDATRPLNTYGKTKVASELAVCAALPRHLIVRTAWLFDPFARNFVTTMLRQGLTHSELTVVNDQYGRPTASIDLARGILRMAKRALTADDHWGIYHLTNSGPPVMRAAFAEAIFQAATPWYGRTPAITPVSSKDYPNAARRPHTTRQW
jgi:dTDP-4-dehydrorhamnose reductase